MTLIILGTFFRGPNWNFFGPFESWNPHTVYVLNNVDLSQMFWNGLLNRPLPVRPLGTAGWRSWAISCSRESPGIIAIIAVLRRVASAAGHDGAAKVLREDGFRPLHDVAMFLLLMMTLPLKMVLRWMFNLKYIVHIPEYFLNF